METSQYVKKSLGHLLNAIRIREKHPTGYRNEIKRCLNEIDSEISSLIIGSVLRQRVRCGAMSFSQANENVPEDGILLDLGTYEALVAANGRWKNISEVFCTRFPNLGPGTTVRLKVYVNREKKSNEFGATVGERCPVLAELLDAVDPENADVSRVGPFNLHPNILLEKMKGDGDGDLVYIGPLKSGKPYFRKIRMVRKPGEFQQEDIDVLFKKASRSDRKDLCGYLERYFDNTPIAAVTYAIKFVLFQMSLGYSDDIQPMHKAWLRFGPEAIDKTEKVMDIRKGEMSPREILALLRWIYKQSRSIRRAKESGNWFALTVTSAKISKISGFIRRFGTLQEYADYICGKRKKLL